ncbi:MAG: glycosyltransferase family 2 protein [Candidatus Korobacteraceae bacterium]|jgi:N-acetylglucosaminyl-diphospho-decaprenol L-rhamnosyltransferase
MRASSKAMSCSAIVVTHNSGATVRPCLEALVGEECEIVVVDNASADDTVQRIEEFVAWHPVRLIANEENLGFGAAVNQGAREATGEVLLILNPDAIAEPGAVAAMLRCLQSTGADTVGGALLEADGQPARGFVFRRLPTLATLAYEVLLVNHLWPGNSVNRRYRCVDVDYSQQQEVEQPAGACLAITRTAWDGIGGFDEQFFPVWFEDVDLCKRLLDGGLKIFYCPGARFRHSGAHSVGQLSFRDKQVFWYTNMLRYARKHFSKGQVFFLRTAIIKGMLLRSVAALFGAGNVPMGEALSAYWGVARAVW